MARTPGLGGRWAYLPWEPQPMASCVGVRLMPMASSRAARPASGRRGQEGGWHQGKPAGGLHFWWPVTASREGAVQTPFPGKHCTCSPASSSRWKCQVSATGDSQWPAAHSPSTYHGSNHHPHRDSSPNSPHFSGLRSSSFFFPSPPPSLPQLPLSLFADHSASPPAPFLQEVSPDSPLTCLGGDSAQEQPLWWPGFVLPTVPSPLAHTRFAQNSC